MSNLKKAIDAFQLNPTDISSVPESFSSEVYSVTLKGGEKAILKIPYSKTKLLREKKILDLLKNTLPVPKVLDFWEGNNEVTGAFLLSYIDGEPISGEIDRELASQMGKLLASLHNVPMEAYEYSETYKNDWWKSILETFENWQEHCKPVMDKDLYSQCIELFHKMYEKMPPADGPCVTHMDYRPGNILVKDSKIAGLIDFESSRGGSSSIDFTKSKLYVWDRYEGTKEAFIKGYQSVRSLPDLESTLPFYLLHNAFGGVSWCVRRNQLDGDFYKENINQLKMILWKYL